MNIQSEYLIKKFRQLAVVVLCLSISACGGGDSGGNIGFADGQSPDPVVLDIPIAYVKRSLPVDEDAVLVINDRREPITFDAGADLFVRERASPTAAEVNVTFEVTNGEGDIKGVNVNAEGTKLIFSMRTALLENVDEDDQPTWNIWQYDLESMSLQRIIASDINAEAGHDLSPAYLPDGRIIFASNRQRKSKAILLDEGKPQFAALDEDENSESFVLHVMNEDGSEISQITFNQSHDLYPMVRTDGTVVFSRWGAKGGNNSMALYQSNPDGTNLELLYGANSSGTGSDDTPVHFLEAAEMPDGRIGTLLQTYEANRLGGEIVLIETDLYVENEQAVAANAGATGPAQEAATINQVRTDVLPSLGGRYSSFHPLWDGTNRMLVSWSQCRLLVEERIVPCTDSNLEVAEVQESDPLYGIWIYDASDDTQLPVVAPEEGIMYTDIVAAQPRDLPTIVFDQAADPELVEAGLGTINIKSVYDWNGQDITQAGLTNLADPAQFTATERPALFVRIVKAVSLPDDDLADVPNSAFGPNRGQGMREVIGYAPVEPDGSVMAKVPADVAFAISVIDDRGRRIAPRHQAWLSVRPGETLECNGCHNPFGNESHGRKDAFEVVNTGATTTGVPFPNTDPALFADFGETMAETKARITCALDNECLELSSDIEFEDIWTDPATAGRPRDESFTYSYSDLETAFPVSAACIENWSSLCRTVINYEEHIHPLWSVDRRVFADNGLTVIENNTCTRCHNTVNAFGNIRVPARQLDLSDGISPDNADQLNSYRELLFQDNAQEIEMGALQDRLIRLGEDPDTGEEIVLTVPVFPSIVGNSAIFSIRFFNRFEEGRTHAGYLTRAELKLIAEWIDIGGQYYNNPFTAAQD